MQYVESAIGTSAKEAFQFFGSDAIPFLIEKLQHKDSALEVQATKLADKASLRPLPFRQAEIETNQAVTALVNLKPFPAESTPSFLAFVDNKP